MLDLSLFFFLFVCILESETKGFSFLNIVTQIIILFCIVFCPQMQHLGLGVWHCARMHTSTAPKAQGSTANTARRNELPLVPNIEHWTF